MIGARRMIFLNGTYRCMVTQPTKANSWKIQVCIAGKADAVCKMLCNLSRYILHSFIAIIVMLFARRILWIAFDLFSLRFVERFLSFNPWSFRILKIVSGWSCIVQSKEPEHCNWQNFQKNTWIKMHCL